MENIKDVRDLIRPFDLMITIDLKDAYCHLFYNQKSRKFAAFSFQGLLFQCVAMLFGVTHGPRWWTKVLRPVVKFFRSKGIRCVVYIDDFIFFLGSDLKKALEIKEWILETLLNLGLSINVKKSSLVPSSRVKFLGFIVDSKKMRLFAPETKVTEIRKMSKKLHKKGQCSVRVLASFLGKISAAAQAVLPWRLCTRALLLNKNRILKSAKNWDTEVILTEDALQELQFWSDKIQDFNGKDILVEEPSWVTISDSSQQSFAGMELTSEDPFMIVKDWDMDSQKMHNNYLETLASTETIKNFILTKDIKKGVLLHKVDNTTAVSYLQKQGGRAPHISKPVEDLWHLCLERDIELRAMHIPGQEVQKDADFLSRMRQKQSEWSLPRKVFQYLDNLWGPFSLDCFATQFNNQIPEFLSWWKDPKAQAWDAMVQKWPVNSYLFPPFSLLGRVLKRILTQKLEVVLITPLWESATWWPVIMNLVVDIPQILPAVLMNLDRAPQQLKWNLVAWKLSGLSSDFMVSPTIPSRWWNKDGDRTKQLIAIGDFTRVGVEAMD